MSLMRYYRVFVLLWVVCLFTQQEVCAQELKLTGKFENCSNTLKYPLTVTNESTKNAYKSFRIEWGDGVKEDLTKDKVNHTYETKGRFQLIFIGIRNDGTEERLACPVVNDNGTPTVGLEAGGDTGLCVGDEIRFTINKLRLNTILTSYYLDFGDGESKEFKGSDFPDASETVITHRYEQSSCNQVGSEGGGIYVTLKVINACGDEFGPKFGPYAIASPITLTFDLPEKECTGNEIDLAGKTGYDPKDCMEVNLMWDVTDEKGKTIENVGSPYVFEERGTYRVRAYGKKKDAECSKNEKEEMIKILQRVTAVAGPLKSEICENESVQLDASASEGDEKLYTWKVISGGSENVTFKQGIHAEKTEAVFRRYGTYRIRLAVDNGCSEEYAEVEVEVKKDPEVKLTTPFPSLCPGATLRLADYVSYDWTWLGNPHHPEWSISGPEEGAKFEFGDKNSEAPILKFTKPGLYTITVQLAGVECGDGTTLKASQAITIFDPEIKLDILPDVTDICEGATVTFTDNSTGVDLRAVWSLTTATGGDVPDKTIVTSGNQTKITIPAYGKYKANVKVSGACDVAEESFDLAVHRAPEIYFTAFPQPFCPTDKFYPGNFMDYRPNGNDDVTFTWEVTGPAPAEIDGENTRTPKIGFTRWGDYTVKVTLSSLTNCDPREHLTASAVLKISNPEQELNITVDKKTICAGESISFVNTSVVGVEPAYFWGVSPATGSEFDPVRNASHRAPLIKFTKSGVYTISVGVQGVCQTETLPFTIIVQEDPEVETDAIPPMCPGPLEMTEERVHYTWNDDWKTGAENQRIVKWKLTVKPDGANCTPAESPEWDKHFPKLELKTPGIYTLQAELKSFANCSGTKTIASRDITVHDPSLRVEVKPEMSADMVALGKNKYQIVEGKPFRFTNNSVAVGLTCLWSADQPDACTISDIQAKEPDITFHKHGMYKIRVDLTGTCCTPGYREFIFVVKGIPEFEFKPMTNRCDNWAELDMKDYLVCDSAGSSEINCMWSITPDNGYVLTEGTPNDMFFKIRFDRNDSYTLTLRAKAEYGGVRTVAQTVHVLNHLVTSKALLSRKEGCTDDGMNVVAENRSTGDSLNYKWRISPATGWSGTLNVEKPDVQFLVQGDYKIYLEVANICDTNTVDYDVHVYSKPSVEVLGNADLGTVCERGYLFVGRDHVSEIKTNNDPLILTLWTISTEGYRWKNGTNSGSEYPDVEFDGEKTYTLKGEFKNHCSETVTVNYTVAVDQFVEVALMDDTTVCAMTGPFRLHAVPHGGIWRVAESERVSEKEGKNFYFNPNVDTDQKYKLFYTRGNGQCLAKDSVSVKVHKLPVVDAGENRTACVNHEPQDLVGITPAFGAWRGTGVLDDVFYPGETGKGQYKLEYWYTDGTTGCPNLDTITMTVYPLPDPAFTTKPKHCVEAEALFTPAELGVGNRFFWDFGDASPVMEFADLPGTHIYTRAGNVEVVAVAESVAGCRDTSEATPVVALALPPQAGFTMDKEAGCGPLGVSFHVDETLYVDTNLRFSWIFGNGNHCETLLPQPDPVVFQPMREDTVYRVTFTVYNQCKREPLEKTIAVHSSPHAGFKMMNKYECSPVNVPFVNTSTGTGNVYIWNFGDGQGSQAKDPDHDYSAENRAKDYIINLTAANRCDTNIFTDTLTVKPNTIRALFSVSEHRICVGDTVCFTNYSSDTSTAIVNQYWEFGDGEMLTTWDACHPYMKADTFYVKLSLDNGCGFAERKDSVYVYAIPKLNIESEPVLCEDDTFHFVLTNDQKLKTVVWNMGNDSIVRTQNPFEFAYADPGMYTVTVNVLSAVTPSCPARGTKTIEVWPKPDVRITPFDTTVCGPYLYQPKWDRHDYYFTWDYGTGEKLTSENEHLYVNDTNFILDYNLVAHVETNRGCKTEYNGHIKVYNSPKAGIGKEISYGRPEKVNFMNLTRDYTECIWYLPDGRVVNSPDNQVMYFEEKALFPLSLAAVNEYGCRDSVALEHRSYMSGLYFPNTFIPHSGNAKVNAFSGVGMGLKEYELVVYDGYGNKIWETNKLLFGEPAEGWNGKNGAGEDLPQGVYIWRARAIFFSEDLWTGDNNGSGNPQTTQGSVLLLRE